MDEVMMWTNNFENFGSKNFNPQKQASKQLNIIHKSLLRRSRWLLAQYLSQEMISEGGHWPYV